MKRLLAVLALSAAVLAMCNFNNVTTFNMKIKLDVINDMRGLVRTLTEKLSSEILSLRPATDYQRLLKEYMSRLLGEAKVYYKKGEMAFLNGNYDVALAYYLIAYDKLYTFQKLTKFFYALTLDDYVNNLKEDAYMVSASLFTLYKTGSVKRGCLNSTRLLYVLVRPAALNLIKEISSAIKNLPDYLDTESARKAYEITSKATAILMMTYATSFTFHQPEKLPLGPAERCPQGYGLAQWLPYACGAAKRAIKPTPCTEFYSFIAYYIGLKGVATALCGVVK